MSRVLVAFLLTVLVTPALACPTKIKPQEDKLGTYKTIFNGEIAGVELSQYQAEIKKCEKGGTSDKCPITVADVEPYEVTVVVYKVFKGTVPKIITLKVAACGSYPPKVHSGGIFFVADDGYVIPLYDDEGQYYWYWFYKLDGLKTPDNY